VLPTPTPAPPPPTKPGAPRVTVPNMVGQSLGDAQAQAVARNLILEFENGEDPSKPNGTVLRQNPPAGQSVAERSARSGTPGSRRAPR
jgi:beta-lactam-binding protein with PASTA domain